MFKILFIFILLVLLAVSADVGVNCWNNDECFDEGMYILKTIKENEEKMAYKMYNDVINEMKEKALRCLTKSIEDVPDHVVDIVSKAFKSLSYNNVVFDVSICFNQIDFVINVPGEQKCKIKSCCSGYYW